MDQPFFPLVVSVFFDCRFLIVFLILLIIFPLSSSPFFVFSFGVIVFFFFFSFIFRVGFGLSDVLIEDKREEGKSSGDSQVLDVGRFQDMSVY